MEETFGVLHRDRKRQGQKREEHKEQMIERREERKRGETHSEEKQKGWGPQGDETQDG